jgi:hypothetical protein
VGVSSIWSFLRCDVAVLRCRTALSFFLVLCRNVQYSVASGCCSRVFMSGFRADHVAAVLVGWWTSRVLVTFSPAIELQWRSDGDEHLR